MVQMSTRVVKKLRGWDFHDSQGHSKTSRSGMKRHRLIKKLSTKASRRSKDGYSNDIACPKFGEELYPLTLGDENNSIILPMRLSDIEENPNHIMPFKILDESWGTETLC